MAEEETQENAPRSPREGSRRPGIAEISREAMEQLGSLVGHPIEGVSSVQRNGEGWVVTVEVLELRRVPNTTDIMASYEVQVDDDGTLDGYQRIRRYARAQTEEG